ARPPKRVAQSLPKPKASQPPIQAPVETDRPVRRRRTRRSGQRWLFTALAIVLSLPVIWLYGGLGNRIITGPATSSGARPPAADAFVPASGQSVPAIQRGASASVKIIRRPRQPLVPGASRQMLAEVRDTTGQALSGSQVRWFSTDSDVARVDSTSGWVRAVGTGRATVIATSGKWRDSAAVVVRRASPKSSDPASISSTAASSLPPGDSVAVNGSAHDGNAAPPAAAESTSNTNDSGSALPGDDLPQPLAGQGYEPEFEPSDAEEPAVQTTVPVFNNAERSRREAWLLTAVEQCYEAIRSRDVARLQELYRPESPSDQDKLNRLTRILRTEEWAAVVGERINGERHLAGDSPSMEFSFQLVWKDAFGGRLTSRPVFRTVIARRGSNWGASGCRIVGTPKL
ncbi:MAG TPA: Ig-like domain-containing protein, partial [Gemmatimonadales bacterium]|nr:Ig-like domain-containing protein [Gemmatimonadales bacterium]